MKKIKVGIVGCGTIGSEIAKACRAKMGDVFSLTAICDADQPKAILLQKSLKGKVAIMKLDELMGKVDLIVEAASAKTSAQILMKAIGAKKDILIMSVGGLLGRERLLVKAAKSGIKVYLPSGAVCGIDGLKSASVGKINSVTLTTRKPLKGLEGAPYLKEKNINLWGLKEETVLFDGNAYDAMKGFPQNINVCAVLSLAGIGADKTRVRIVTAPGYLKNVHEVEVEGEFGRLSTKTENVPSKTNPKTSQLAVFSAVATLGNVAKNVRIGT